MTRACVLVSGGADSAVLLAEACKRFKQVYPVYVRFGLRWEAAEIYWLRKFLRAIRSPVLRPLALLAAPMQDTYGAHWAFSGRVPGYRSQDREVYLPGRNLILLAKSGVLCARQKIPVIHLGSLKGNPFADSSPAFLRLMSDSMSAALQYKINVETPFSRLSKKKVMARGQGLPLHLTFSCLSPHGIRPCGHCNKCAERDRVFKQKK